MKVKLNPAIESMSGQLGEMVFRELRGKTIVSRKATMNAEPTANQVAHRERFKKATAYGNSVMADPTVRTLYEAAAKAKDVPVFSVTVADYFNAPTINNIDFMAYDGKAGGTITVDATDDFEVASVHVSIQDAQGTAIESGNALKESGRWRYTAKIDAPAEAELVVKVVATDRPGGTAIETIAL